MVDANAGCRCVWAAGACCGPVGYLAMTLWGVCAMRERAWEGKTKSCDLSGHNKRKRRVHSPSHFQLMYFSAFIPFEPTPLLHNLLPPPQLMTGHVHLSRP